MASSEPTVVRATMNKLPAILITIVLTQMIVAVGWGMSVDRRTAVMEANQTNIKEDVEVKIERGSE